MKQITIRLAASVLVSASVLPVLYGCGNSSDRTITNFEMEFKLGRFYPPDERLGMKVWLEILAPELHRMDRVTGTSHQKTDFIKGGFVDDRAWLPAAFIDANPKYRDTRSPAFLVCYTTWVGTNAPAKGQEDCVYFIVDEWSNQIGYYLHPKAEMKKLIDLMTKDKFIEKAEYESHEW